MQRLLQKNFFDYLVKAYGDNVLADLIGEEESEELPKNKKKKNKKNKKKGRKADDSAMASNNKLVVKQEPKTEAKEV